MPAHLLPATPVSKLLDAWDSVDSYEPLPLCSCLSRSRALRQSSIHGNTVVGAQTLLSSIQCNWPLKFVSHFWGAVQPFPCISNREAPRWSDFCFLSAEERSALVVQTNADEGFRWLPTMGAIEASFGYESNRQTHD